MSYSSIPLSDALGPYDRKAVPEYPHDIPLQRQWGSKDFEAESSALKSTTEPRDITEYSPAATTSAKPLPRARVTSFSNEILDDTQPSFDRSKRVPTNERPKPVLEYNTRTMVIKVLPHIFATIIISSIVQLSFRNRYWMDLVPPKQQIAPGLTQGGALNALQLAAKLVELVILASLSFIVLYTSQRYLFGKSGLPLGLLASPHQIITGELLRRKGFWAAWSTKSTFNGATPLGYTPFWILCLLATMLVTVTGPSAAIAVIPSLDWFPLHRPFISEPAPFYIFNASAELWPKVLTQDSLNGKDSGNDCLSALSRYQGDCPSGGFRVLYEWSNNVKFDNLQVGSNITTPNDRGDTRRITNVRTCAGPTYGRATAMSITSAISNALVGYWSFARSNFNGTAMDAAQPKVVTDPTQSLFSPRVDVICGAYAYWEANIQNQKEMVFPTFDRSAPRSHVPESALDNDRFLNATDFAFTPGTDSEEGISLNGLATVPITRFVNDAYVQASLMLPCSIYAQWAPVAVWFEPNTQDQVSMQTLDSDSRCLNNDVFRSTSTDTMHNDRQARNMTIDMRYARSINQEIDFSDANRPVLAAILEQFWYESSYLPGALNFRAPQPGSGNRTDFTDDEMNGQVADVVAAVVAGVVTDGLSRVAAGGHYPYSAPFFMQHIAGTNNITGLNPISTASGGQTVPLNITEADLGNYIRLNPTIQRFGYGYKWHGNKTTQFGICVLLVHMVLALGHTGLVFYRTIMRHEGIGSSLDTIGEVVALALNSTSSSKIQNTCGGIQEAETWREVVAVREVYEGHLEMVVGDEASRVGARPRVGVEYGRVREKGD